jgi:hypothetical protein
LRNQLFRRTNTISSLGKGSKYSFLVIPPYLHTLFSLIELGPHLLTGRQKALQTLLGNDMQAFFTPRKCGPLEKPGEDAHSFLP